MRKTIPNGAIDDQNLAGLCEEVRYNLQATIVPSWQHLTTLIPLIEERLLCATGDPELRLDACWDRRPRGTFLDFGWTRKKPDMPKEWSFFAHCKPETLISLLIEVIEAVEDASTGLVEEWFHRANHQAWYTISLGTILERCYARRLLIQPQPENISKYRKHILYVLAATELMNTCFKSRQVKSLADFSVGRLECDNVEDLLRTPLSEISNALLCHSWSRPLYALGSGVFLPSNLKIPMLTRIGGINVDWTEYMQEHLTFDPETMTVYVYWFFSHISDNASWHLYCERYGCDTRHSGSPRPTYTGDLKYREEVLQSYRWLFSASPAEALEQLCDLPLPWWLVPLEEDDVILPWHRSGAWIEDQAAVKIRKSKWNKLMSRATRVFSKQREKQNKRPSVRSLLKNSANQKCELPIDCKELLDFLDREDDETTGTLPFARFPELGPRVKILMEFMEKQKPRGFFALWRDKRDSSSWYTFWAAVLLGVAAFILALAGLGLASAQTWASFKALDLQTDSSPTPGPSR
ncbi:hypothetical protein BKA64DRAFT_354802 [Cadophora sp. MPI-SDFR-AT-0126]|nr:hypothetical protein BKA64DRAFT_354802 [Leotiomycetes sp. MPI-SDFR-AT-0126]